ncbi:MAG: YveK family protein [Bacillota bacterium]
MEQAELDLREIFLVLRRRFWLLAMVPLLAALTAGVVSYTLLEPVYRASTTLWVIKDGQQINYNELLLSRNLTKTYAEVARSRAVMADVIKQLGLQGVTVEALQKKLTVTPVRDTEILSFAIEDTDPAMAARLAAAVAESFKGQIRTYMKLENVVVVDPAVVPTNPIKPRKMMNIAVAFVLGLMAATGLAFLLEYLDTSIKSPDDVSRYLGLPVLGVIPVLEMKSQPAAEARRVRQRQPEAQGEVEL